MENKLPQLPTYADLAGSPEEYFKKDKLNLLLSQPPRKDWIKRHPLIKKKVDGKMVALEYIPIYTVRYLMRAIFGSFRREIKEVKQLANSVIAIVRVHYRNPMTGEWDWQDGTGAAPLQVDSGADPTDSSAIKSGAVQMAAPSAVSYAFKNACEEIGEIFGSNLQTPDAMEYKGMIYGEPGESSVSYSPAPIIEEIETNF